MCTTGARLVRSAHTMKKDGGIELLANNDNVGELWGMCVTSAVNGGMFTTDTAPGEDGGEGGS